MSNNIDDASNVPPQNQDQQDDHQSRMHEQGHGQNIVVKAESSANWQIRTGGDDSQLNFKHDNSHAPNPERQQEQQANRSGKDDPDKLADALDALTLLQKGRDFSKDSYESPPTPTPTSPRQPKVESVSVSKAEVSTVLEQQGMDMKPHSDVRLPPVLPPAYDESHDHHFNSHQVAKSNVQVIFQEACTLHRYTRTNDTSLIVERPERLRAVKIGTACAWSRYRSLQNQETQDNKLDPISTLLNKYNNNNNNNGNNDMSAIETGLNKLGLNKPATAPVTPQKQSLQNKVTRPNTNEPIQLVVPGPPFDVLRSSASTSLLSEMVSLIHNEQNESPYENTEENDNDNDNNEPTKNSHLLDVDPKTSPFEAASSPFTTPSPSPLPSPVPVSANMPSSLPTSQIPSPITSAHPTHTQQSQQLQSTELYGSQLLKWILSSSLLPNSGSEVPEHLPQGDLYWCPESKEAVEGAIGSICEAVDANRKDGNIKVVAIRPPGHHCGNASPSGFCLVNNVMVGIAHAYLKHNVDRAIILDIDLHHGNGTQEIARKINAEAWAKRQEQLAAKAAAAKSSRRTTMGGRSPGRRGKKSSSSSETNVEEQTDTGVDALQVYYGSLHDIWSYPCEDGDPLLISEASMNISGGHGQWVTNVHLEKWKDEQDFHERVYPIYARKLLTGAARFVEETNARKGRKDRIMVWISMGLDASEHEYSSMSRHGRNVPISFYRRVAKDIKQMCKHDFGSDVNVGLVSILEGGYSDMALSTGMASMLDGLCDDGNGRNEDDNDDNDGRGRGHGRGHNNKHVGTPWVGTQLRGLERLLRRKWTNIMPGTTTASDKNKWEDEAIALAATLIKSPFVNESEEEQRQHQTATASRSGRQRTPIPPRTKMETRSATSSPTVNSSTVRFLYKGKPIGKSTLSSSSSMSSQQREQQQQQDQKQDQQQ